MNEIKSIQVQVERLALTLSHRIENIYSSLEELKNITEVLFDTTPHDINAINKWLKEEEFNADDLGLYKSDKSLELFKKKSLADDALTYHWSASLKDDACLLHRFYALRNIGKRLGEIKKKLGNITIIYYQDIIKNACVAYPYFEINQVIPADFNWSEYYSCASVNPANNPRREIQWSPPNIDYAGEGLISIASIPMYDKEKIIGVWSIDVPLETIHQHCILDTSVPKQINFITDFDGNIIEHPSVGTEIDKEKGSFLHTKIENLGGGFKELDLNDFKTQEKGELEIIDADGKVLILVFEIIPKIEWIVFTTFPKDAIFESVRDKITDAFNTMKSTSVPNTIDLEVNSEMQILIDSYNDMIQVLAYNQIEREKAQKEALEAQHILNEELEIRVKEEVEKNRKKDQQLIEQSRLAQMGEMISMIAHQWRQPITAISMGTNNILLDIELDTINNDTLKDNIEDISNTMQELSKTIDDFRNFYKPDKESVSKKLEDVVKKSLNIIKTSLLNNDINIIEEYKSNEEIKLYDNEMIHVIINILQNAQDNFQENNIKEAYIKITTDNRTISICDNGGGIPENIMGKIFDPYFSTKKEKNGTGLGLYMSKTIVEEHHNGKLTVVNTDDGVCFKIELGIISEE